MVEVPKMNCQYHGEPELDGPGCLPLARRLGRYSFLLLVALPPGSHRSVIVVQPGKNQ